MTKIPLDSIEGQLGLAHLCVTGAGKKHVFLVFVDGELKTWASDLRFARKQLAQLRAKRWEPASGSIVRFELWEQVLATGEVIP